MLASWHVVNLCYNVSELVAERSEKIIVVDGGDALEENMYGNTSSMRRRSQSEPIPVEKLEWYNRTNVSLIKKQYNVSTACFLLTFKERMQRILPLFGCHKLK